MKKTISIVGLVIFLCANSWAQKRTALGINVGFGVRPDARNFTEFRNSEQRNWSVNTFLEHRVYEKWYLSTGVNLAWRNFYPARVMAETLGYIQVPFQVSYELTNGFRLGGGYYLAKLNPFSTSYNWYDSTDRLYDRGFSFQAILALSSRFRLSLQSELGVVKHQQILDCSVGMPTEAMNLLPRGNRYVGLHLGFRIF